MQNKNILFLTLSTFCHGIINAKQEVNRQKYSTNVMKEAKHHYDKNGLNSFSHSVADTENISILENHSNNNFSDENLKNLNQEQIIQIFIPEIKRATWCIDCSNTLLEKLEAVYAVEEEAMQEYEKCNKKSPDIKKIKTCCRNIRNKVNEAEKDVGICFKNLIKSKKSIVFHLNIGKKYLKGDLLNQVNDLLHQLNQIEEKIKIYKNNRSKLENKIKKHKSIHKEHKNRLKTEKKAANHSKRENTEVSKIGKNNSSLLNISRENIQKIVKEKNDKIASLNKESLLNIKDINKQYTEKINKIKLDPNSKELIRELINRRKNDIELRKKQTDEMIKTTQEEYMKKIEEAKKVYESNRKGFDLPLNNMSKNKKIKKNTKVKKVDFNPKTGNKNSPQELLPSKRLKVTNKSLGHEINPLEKTMSENQEIYSESFAKQGKEDFTYGSLKKVLPVTPKVEKSIVTKRAETTSTLDSSKSSKNLVKTAKNMDKSDSAPNKSVLSNNKKTQSKNDVAKAENTTRRVIKVNSRTTSNNVVKKTNGTGVKSQNTTRPVVKVNSRTTNNNVVKKTNGTGVKPQNTTRPVKKTNSKGTSSNKTKKI